MDSGGHCRAGFGGRVVGVSAREVVGECESERSRTVWIQRGSDTFVYRTAECTSASDQQTGSIYETADGKRELRLTNFMTSNGPDVHVVLAESADEKLGQTLLKSDLNDVEVGLLKGNQGNQNYELPASADLSKYDAVVIYCERFRAVFGVAKLDKF